MLALGARALFLFHGTLAVWKCQSTYNTAFMYILLGTVSNLIHHVMSITWKSFWSCDCLNSRTVERTSYNAFWGGIIHSCHSWWSRIQIHFTLYCFISWLVHFSRIVSRNSRIHEFQGNFAKKHFEVDSLWKISTGNWNHLWVEIHDYTQKCQKISMIPVYRNDWEKFGILKFSKARRNQRV